FTDPPAFNVLTVAEKPRPVLTRGGLSVNPHHRLADCPRPDLLLVPGGQGTRREMHNALLTDWIKARSPEAEVVLSVCTGALLLARAGLRDGVEATTHHGPSPSCGRPPRKRRFTPTAASWTMAGWFARRGSPPAST